MSSDRDQGPISADIPPEVVAEALAAVDRAGAGGASPDAGDEPARLRAELEMSQARSRKMYEQLREEHDLRLRAAADLENLRKRTRREQEEVTRYGLERFVKEVLPVLDNLDRAIAAAGEHPLRTGIEMTRRLLEEALGRFGVKPFSALGTAFDPRVHEALLTVAAGDHPPGTVISEEQRGFMLHDRLLRPAAVIVVAAPAPAPVPGPAPGAPGAERGGLDGPSGE